jgi:hypothetical protein
MELAADDSLAAILARSKFGIAMAAIIKIIATTINSSMREKPFCLCIRLSFSLGLTLDVPLVVENAKSLQTCGLFPELLSI